MWEGIPLLPELEKILMADRKAREAVDRAQQEAEALLAATRARIEALKTELESELEQLKQTAAGEILRQAEARAAEIAADTDRYLDRLQEQAQAQEEEAVSFLVSQVLAG